MKALLRDCGLHSVCEAAGCPNISECFSKRVATFLILGDICTRGCRFCNINKGLPHPADYEEPQRVMAAVKDLNLRHVVITSPTRDDLADGGAGMFAATIKSVRTLDCVRHVEALIPDFSGNHDALKTVIDAAPDIIAHNLETVPSLYSRVRCQANYHCSLGILAQVKQSSPGILTKSGLMLGLGETDGEIEEVLGDLRKIECDFLSIGQYLPPSGDHYPCVYIPPEKFKHWEETAHTRGFKSVKSAPYVRSSYLAHEYLGHTSHDT